MPGEDFFDHVGSVDQNPRMGLPKSRKRSDMLRDGVPYRELGAGYTPAPNVPSRVRYHLQQLQQLGVDVSPLRTQAA